MDAAIARLVRAVQEGEHIVVFGDYDVDGATSSALLLRFFRAVGGNIGVYIPDRRKEGYGPNTPALLKLKAEGAAVVVTVDCGVTAFEPLAEAKRAGLDISSSTITWPRSRCPTPSPWSIPTGSTTPARTSRWPRSASPSCWPSASTARCATPAGTATTRPEPDLRQWLDLVALGTVCDVVPLTGVNRALVRQGLKVMAERRNAGLAALADVARLKEAPGAYHLGFLLGPRVNAGGRVGQADLGARLLSSDDPHEVGALALRLDEFNAERRAIERDVLDQAISRVEGLYGPDRKGLPAALVVESEGWHVGVIGIVASRLVERYGRPAFVIGLDGGSGQGLGPLGARRRPRRGGDRGAPGRTAGERRRPCHGGGPDGDARGAACPCALPRRAHRAAARRGAAGARARHRCGPVAGGGDPGTGRA